MRERCVREGAARDERQVRTRGPQLNAGTELRWDRAGRQRAANFDAKIWLRGVFRAKCAVLERSGPHTAPLVIHHSFQPECSKMGAFDSRNSKKMRRKKSQVKLKERLKRQAEATKAARGN